MAATEHKERNEISHEELWRTIPFEEQAEVDRAIDRGSKPEAVNRCMCSGRGFTLQPASGLVNRRAAELARRHIPKKK
jgi:hypothetical protein